MCESSPTNKVMRTQQLSPGNVALDSNSNSADNADSQAHAETHGSDKASAEKSEAAGSDSCDCAAREACVLAHMGLHNIAENF